MISEQELDNILFLEFSDISKSEQKRMREDTLKFNAWLEGRGKAWPSAEDFAGYVNERKRRVGKKESQPYAAADKAGARVSAIYEAIARQKGENSMSEDFKATQPEDSLDVTEVAEATQPVEVEQPVHEPSTLEATEATPEVEPVQGVHEQETAPKPRGRNGGRKIKDAEGEKRSEKVMLYLTPSLMTDIKDLAGFYGKSLTDYIIGLIETHAEEKQAKLASFRELRDNE